MTFAVSIAVQSLNFQLERPTKIVDFIAGISKGAVQIGATLPELPGLA